MEPLQLIGTYRTPGAQQDNKERGSGVLIPGILFAKYLCNLTEVLLARDSRGPHSQRFYDQAMEVSHGICDQFHHISH
jgi:hypothetical protein